MKWTNSEKSTNYYNCLSQEERENLDRLTTSKNTELVINSLTTKKSQAQSLYR